MMHAQTQGHTACAGIVLLAPDSRAATWDDLPAGQNSFGPDVAFINAALAQTFALYNVDPTKLGIQGFSDGATYALGLGEQSAESAMLSMSLNISHVAWGHHGLPMQCPNLLCQGSAMECRNDQWEAIQEGHSKQPGRHFGR